MNRQSYFTDTYQRFFFLHGHTNDEFCPPNLGILTLEEVLHQHLHQLGYQRIIFYNGRQKIYFHDHDSQQLSRPDIKDLTSQHEASPSQSASPSRICAGPLGQQSLALQAPITAATPEADTHSLQLGSMSDLDVVGFLNRCMHSEQYKTAVLFTDGLDFITRFQEKARRQMAASLSRWGRLLSTNHNICLFLLPNTDIQRLGDLLERHGWYFLRSQIFQNENKPSKRVITLGAPRQDEVKNLLHYWRLKRQLPTNWRILQQSIIPITRHLCAEGHLLKSLSYQLQTCQTLDKNTLHHLSGYSDRPPALTRLQQLHGLDVVYEKVTTLIRRHQEHDQHTAPLNTLYQRDISRLLPPPVPQDTKHQNLHIVLKGNPGTGKTTVANLVAEIYRDTNLVELGHIVKASREDLVAGYIGHTAIQTAQKITDAMGGILFVDEAYRLSEGGENDFGKEAIETIMEAMSNHMGEFAVIIAGYPEKIDQFLKTNPGLKRRFSSSNILTIPDYEPEHLHAIFLEHLAKEQRSLSAELSQQLPQFFKNWHSQRDVKTFGNAGDVLNLYQAMDERRATRAQGQFIFSVDDVPKAMRGYLPGTNQHDINELLQRLDNVIGLQRVKQTLHSIINRMKVQQLRDEQHPSYTGHYLALGNTGTGKTMIARLLGQFFQQLGLLAKGHVVKAERAELVGGYSGRSAEKTTAMIERSLDGILLIEDADKLVQSEHDEAGEEALGVLLNAMNNQRHRLCIICAGRSAPMTRFLRAHAALSTHLSTTLQFDNYQPDEMLQMFIRLAAERQLHLAEGVEARLAELFHAEDYTNDESFTNIHAIRQLFEQCSSLQNNRLVAQQITDRHLLYQLELTDIPDTLQ